MDRNVVALSFLATLILSAIGWARLTVESYTGDVAHMDEYHPCPTLMVRFEQSQVPMAIRKCDCSDQVQDIDSEIAVHPPKALVEAASPGDRIGLSLHEYAPLLGGEVKRAAKWVLAGGTVGKQTYVVSPAGPFYRSIVLTGLAPLILGVVLAVGMGLIFRRKAAVGE